jgi:hypothetical protein
MARKKKIVRIPVEEWCSCSEWHENQWMLSNHPLMNYCVFCGKKLEKEKKI